MKALNVMMAKELLDLQIDQMSLLLEELGLRTKVMDLDIKLGLCTKDWYDRKCLMLNNKRTIYRDLLEDYQMTQIAIAELEQKDAEELHQLEESQRLIEVASATGHVDDLNVIKASDIELKPHESHEEVIGDIGADDEEQITDTSYEVVEKEEEENFKLVEAKGSQADNTLDEKKKVIKKKP